METKSFFCLVFFLQLLNVANAQRQAYSTINGGCINSVNNCSGPNQGMILKFNDDSLEQIIEPVNMSLATYYSRAAFSDTNGNLLFASNGWRLVDSQGNVLSNKLWRDEMPHPGDSPDNTTVLLNQGPLFLDDPGDSSKAFLLYSEYELYDAPPYTISADSYFSYAYLDIPTQSLLSKDNTILNIPTQKGNMQACRHANGRDWWIIKPGIQENKFFVGLLDPSGIEMNEITISAMPDRVQFRTFSQFSFAGDRFVHYSGNPNRILYTFDFDRCAGELGNMQMHDLSDSLRDGDLNALTLSPDGSKVYMKKGNYISQPQQVQGLLQYDLNTSLYYYVCYYATAPQLTPNGKTVLIQSFYVQDSVMHRTLSEIMNPNEAGIDCNLIEHKYPIQNNATFVMPSNYANFKLGALAGSSCDTLSTGIPTSINYQNLKFKVYPNPTETSLTIETETPAFSTITISDMLGREVWQGAITEHTTVLTKEIEELKPGIYWVEIQEKKTGKRAGKKFVKR